MRFLMRILAKEEHHSPLSESYNEIMNQHTMTMTTKSQTRGISVSFPTNNTQYHNNFLPRTIHDLKGQSEQIVCNLQCEYWADRAYRTCTDKEYRSEDWINKKNATNNNKWVNNKLLVDTTVFHKRRHIPYTTLP